MFAPDTHAIRKVGEKNITRVSILSFHLKSKECKSLKGESERLEAWGVGGARGGGGNDPCDLIQLAASSFSCLSNWSHQAP